MNELSDPTMGWDFSTVLGTDAGQAVYDIYGKLYVHIYSVLGKFKRRLSDIGARFELHNIDLLSLPDVYAPATFDRIEVNLHGHCHTQNSRLMELTDNKHLRRQISWRGSHARRSATSAAET